LITFSEEKAQFRYGAATNHLLKELYFKISFSGFFNYGYATLQRKSE
jgi:hypothetical protein